MKKLTLEHIAPYLPYRLKVLSRYNKIYEIVIHKNAIAALTTIEEVFENDDSLILRPISDLTKPIRVDGVEQIPIVEIGKMFGYNNLVKNECDGEISYGYDEVFMGEHQGYEFAWCEKTQMFGLYYDYKDDNVGALYSYFSITSFRYLAKHKFDFMGLIDSGLAVDVNTLEINPYK